MATTPPVSGKERSPTPIAPAGVEPEKASPEEPALSPLFVTNLLAILAVGVAFCAWILHFTEWFPAIGEILVRGARASAKSGIPQPMEASKALEDAIARARRGGER